MTEENSALNTGDSPSLNEDGSLNYDDLDGSKGASAQQTSSDEGTLNTDGEPKHEEAIPYDRFKEVNEKAKSLESRVSEAERLAAVREGELQALKEFYARQTAQPKERAEQVKLDFENIAAMEDDEIAERFEKEPKAFLGNLVRQLRHEIMSHVETKQGQKSKEQSVKDDFDRYSKENEDFLPMINSGEIKRFLAANPYYNAFTAHAAIKAANQSKSFDEKLSKAIAEAEKKKESELIKQYQTKGKLGTTLGGATPPVAQPTQDDMLKHPEKYGGKINVLVDRLNRFRTKAA